MSIRIGAFDADPGIRPSLRQFVAYAATWEPIPDDGLVFGAGPGAFLRRRGTYVLALATVARPPRKSEAESAEIATNPRASRIILGLVPKMEAICGGV